MFCDMHTHSDYSDGTLSPKELAELGVSKGLSALALTDHNSALGLKSFLKAGEGLDIELVSGVEFSTEICGKELHIVGLFIPESRFSDIEKFTENSARAKDKSNKDLISKLNSVGISISYEEVLDTVQGEKFNRANIASVLVKKGYAESVEEAFNKYLHKSAGFYTPAEKPSSADTVRFINSLGAVSIWAHPTHSVKDRDLLQRILKELIDAGLDGIEVRHSSFSDEDIKYTESLAESYSLLKSGGSDFHGKNKPDIDLGEPHISYNCFEKLKNRYREKSYL